MINLIDKNIYKLTLYYSLFIAVYCCCSLIIPLQIISSNSIIKLFFIVFGIFLASFNLFVKKAYLYIVQLKWLILFFIFNFVTIILNGKYGYTSNIKDAIVFYIYFFSTYSGLSLLNKQEVITIVNKFFKIIYCFLSFGSIVSLYQFLAYKGYHVYDYKGLLIRQGFIESRLFGIFASPNYLSILIIISCIYMITIHNKKSYVSKTNYILYFSIFINYIYVILSGSRTAFLALLLTIILFVIYILIFEKSFRKKSMKILMVLCVFFSSYYGVKTVSDNYLKLNNAMIIEDKHIEKLTLERTDTSEENISNNRFAIWQGMIELIPNKPLFGVSSGNWYEVSKEYDPHNYIVEEKYLAHNGYLELLFYNGVFGLVIMGIFIFNHYKKVVLNILNSSSNDLRNFNFSIFIIINIILFSNLLLSSTFYGLALLGFILFSILGLSSFLSIYDDNKIYELLTEKEIKETELNILKYIDSICKNNNINYQLAYGTLLGAVRHKGFIPWDDDIDIALLRDDYEKLHSYIDKDNNSKYKIISYKNDYRYNLPFFRVYDVDTFYENNYSRFESLKNGICVDVFPFDDYKDINNIIKKLDKYRQLSSYSFYGLRNSQGNEIMNIPRYIISMLFSIFIPRYWIKKMDNKAKEKFDSNYVDYLLEVKSKDTKLDKKTFFDSCDLEFENYKFKAPRNYNEVLTKIYGENYMEIPPEENRISHAEFKAYKRIR